MRVVSPRDVSSECEFKVGECAWLAGETQEKRVVIRRREQRVQFKAGEGAWLWRDVSSEYEFKAGRRGGEGVVRRDVSSGTNLGGEAWLAEEEGSELRWGRRVVRRRRGRRRVVSRRDEQQSTNLRRRRVGGETWEIKVGRRRGSECEFKVREGVRRSVSANLRSGRRVVSLRREQQCNLGGRMRVVGRRDVSSECEYKVREGEWLA
ncbi:hypothetical protein EVAR_75701_1 [Eumeta japonica]|uniref:Uncharacterized protein n=1 Tax=Eumeta variegata TaxID=151549 RepID=A0A4C1W2Q4_EUMVA|nr:hypothetical protein EVAR_75701_1 [Eumeta japonica]